MLMYAKPLENPNQKRLQLRIEANESGLCPPPEWCELRREARDEQQGMAFLSENCLAMVVA